MRIGILAAPDSQGGMRLETARIREEIHDAGHVAKLIDYTRLGIRSGGEGVSTIVGDDDALKVDLVIPYCDTDVLAGERVLSALMSVGIPSTLDPEKIHIARNKMLAQLAFHKANIRHPDSVAPPIGLLDNLEPWMDIVEPDANKKLVVKALYGTEGDGVWLKTRTKAHKIVKLLNDTNQEYMFQQAIPRMPGVKRANDKGIVVCDGVMVTAFQRFAQKGEFRANLAKKGIGVPYTPTDGEEYIAITTSKALGIRGLNRTDTVDSKYGPLVLEDNVFPGHRIEKITGVNIAKVNVRFAIEHYEQFRAELAFQMR